jgi:HEAT repeat protein
MDNPFNPFVPLGSAVQDIAADRTALVDRIMARLSDQQLPFSVAAGGLGVGKSTLLRVQLFARLKTNGWHPIVIVASSGFTIEELLLQVAVSLGYEFSSVFDRLGIRGSPSADQRIGSVSDSKDVSVLQAHIEGGAKDSKPWSAMVAAAALREIAKSKGVRIALLLDQSEHLFLGSQLEAAILIVGSIVRAVSTADGQLGAVIAIRDEYLHQLLVLAEPFPQITSGIVPIPGLRAEEASAFVLRALSQYGASFSDKLLQAIIRRLSGISGSVWPIALHACCQPLAEISKLRKKSASISDLKKLGDLSGVVGTVLVSGIRAADPPLADDILFCLYVVADFCRREGQIRFEQLVQALPAFPIEDVSRMVRILRTLRLVEELRPSFLRLAHDSMSAAVYGLRHASQTEEDVRSIDRSVIQWGSNDQYLGSEDAMRFLTMLGSGPPTPHLVLVVGSLFRARAKLDYAWLDRVRPLLSRVDRRQLIHLITEHAARHGRGPALCPEEVFVLALTEGLETVGASMAGLMAASRGPTATWSEIDYTDALLWSVPMLLGKWLGAANLSDATTSALRCVVRVLLLHPEITVERTALISLWNSAPSVIKPELLSLIASRLPDIAADLALESCNSAEAYMRAGAADVAKMLEGRVSTKIIGRCLQDTVATVRRRGIFALHKGTVATWEPTLLNLLRSDPSSLVREACLEAIAHLPLKADCRNDVRFALTDKVDFVRESAVYALAHIMPAPEAADAVSSLIQDPAPKVREAAIRILSNAQTKAPIETVLNDLRSGPPSLRIAAAEFLTYASSDDVDVVLENVIADRQTDRDTLIACLKSAGLRRSAICLPTIGACLSSQDVAVVSEAIIALTLIGTPDSVDLLESSAFHKSIDVRERVVYALAELGGTRAISTLMGCLSDPREEIRVRAIFALGRLQASEAWPRVNLLNESTPQLRDAIQYYKTQVGSKRISHSGAE